MIMWLCCGHVAVCLCGVALWNSMRNNMWSCAVHLLMLMLMLILILFVLVLVLAVVVPNFWFIYLNHYSFLVHALPQGNDACCFFILPFSLFQISFSLCGILKPLSLFSVWSLRIPFSLLLVPYSVSHVPHPVVAESHFCTRGLKECCTPNQMRLDTVTNTARVPPVLSCRFVS